MPTPTHSLAPLDDRVAETLAYSLVSEPFDTLTQETVARLATDAGVPAARVPALSGRLYRAVSRGALSGLTGCDLDDAVYDLVLA